MDVERNANVSPQGLTRDEAATRLRQYGPNAVPEAKPHLFLAIAKKFWAPVPWMLEVTIILELFLGKRPEAIIIGFLLVFNAGLGFVQETRAQNALALLRPGRDLSLTRHLTCVCVRPSSKRQLQMGKGKSGIRRNLFLN